MPLDRIYDSKFFREQGHALIDLLADHLQDTFAQTDDSANHYNLPQDSYKYWYSFEGDNPMAIFKAIQANSIHLHHPNYMGHQVSVPAPIAALASLQGALLNNGMAVYEMGVSASAIEKVVIDRMKNYFGFVQGDGILTSGGTIANLTALLAARNIKAQETIWKHGQHKKYAFMVSCEAHYCIDRAVRIMGWGDDGIVKIPVDHNYKMRTDLLEYYFQQAKHNGIEILGVVGSAPTTSTGIYDNLEEIGRFCSSKNIWFHIDAAHGGPAVFSTKYAYLMSGAHCADSITVDAHKMMMVPGLTSALFF